MSEIKLHLNAVSPELLDLLISIQSNDSFKDLRLVGGTALALQYGHRKSIDLDFFGSLELTNSDIAMEFSKFGKVEGLKNSPSIKVYTVNGIKIDLVNYPFPWLEDPVLANKLVLAGDKDIAAMKIAAITGRGSKKDFIDLYFLLKKYTLFDMLSWYCEKFPDASEYLAVKSLVYFQDADNQETPEMLLPMSWENVKEEIVRIHRAYV